MNSKFDPQGDSVKLDLVITDESDPSDDVSGDDTAATEVLCLRILSHKTRFRFGGLEISVKSPAFEVGKTFNVSLDEQNRLAGIESFKEFQPHSEDVSPHSSRAATPCGSRPSSRRVSLVSSMGLKPARIVVNPSNETEENEGLPLLSARMILEEERDRDSSVDRKTRTRQKSKKKKKRGSESSSDPPPQSARRSPLSSPFRRMASPSIIRRLMGGYESSDQSSSDSPKLVSVGVGTTSDPRESLYFDMEGSLRRCRSCRK